jgi:hypothetical protein
MTKKTKPPNKGGKKRGPKEERLKIVADPQMALDRFLKKTKAN